MTLAPEDRRRIGAVSALVAGIFLGLCLIPEFPSGMVGEALGSFLWRSLGVGAVGLPLLGLALGLAGFDRLPRLDMKRAAVLIGGLAILVPFTVGIVTEVDPDRLDPTQFDQWEMAARASGVAPGFLAYGVTGLIGQAGGLLLAFLLASALTILTIAWHPLLPLEKGDPGATKVKKAPKSKGSKLAPLPMGEEDEDEVGGGAPVAAAAVALGGKKKALPKPKASGSNGPSRTSSANDELPPVDLLQPPPPQDTVADEAELNRLGQSLIVTLKTFKVDGDIAGRTSGPVVTQFEVVPAPGVKAGRIMALADDLAITMRASSIRVAPIPGKGAVGVEIPNPTPKMVTLREMLESEEWDRSRTALPVALGRDLEGKPVIADLAKMPHLLIAGATGTGKSVGINSIITSLVYRYTAQQLRFLMVDPKMVELSMYNELPHLRHKVVTNNNDAARVLKWAVYEMNRRYELLNVNGSRNLADFNRKVEEGKQLKNPARPQETLKDISAREETTPPAPVEPEIYTGGILPYIVVIVDELADLMMTVAAEVETPLAMLAQKARAIGIHLILATQRPSVNVLTGLIKANFPSRIAFRVASKVDSRTILDQNGAEALLGNGDMLFVPPGKSEPMRIQGAYIGTEESEKLMEWFKARREASQAVAAVGREGDILEFMRSQESEGTGSTAGEGAEDRDPLFREAAEACVQNQGGSTSLLQRKLRIGYGRAARIIDQLYAAGILGPPDGSKPRDVLIGYDQLDEYCG